MCISSKRKKIKLFYLFLYIFILISTKWEIFHQWSYFQKEEKISIICITFKVWRTLFRETLTCAICLKLLYIISHIFINIQWNSFYCRFQVLSIRAVYWLFQTRINTNKTLVAGPEVNKSIYFPIHSIPKMLLAG